jgi:hypothetical protein
MVVPLFGRPLSLKGDEMALITSISAASNPHTSLSFLLLYVYSMYVCIWQQLGNGPPALLLDSKFRPLRPREENNSIYILWLLVEGGLACRFLLPRLPLGGHGSISFLIQLCVCQLGFAVCCGSEPYFAAKNVRPPRQTSHFSCQNSTSSSTLLVWHKKEAAATFLQPGNL